MTAMPANAPIATAQTGMPTRPWLQWFQELFAAAGGGVVPVDTTARSQAAEAEAEAATLRAQLAALEKRVSSLETDAVGRI